jgi:diguanylate cyclase (GGDEF)-like protein
MKLARSSNPHILIVTASEPDAAVLAALAERGYGASAMEGTEIALQQACEEAFDLVVLDRDGIAGEAMRWLDRIQESRRPAGVIVIGARPSPEEAIRFLRAGAFDFLIKPVPVERLLEAVEQAIENRRSFTRIMGLSECLQSANESLLAQKKCLERERDRLIKRNHDLGLLNRIGEGLVGSLQADAVVQVALERTAELIPYDLAALAWLNGAHAWSCSPDAGHEGQALALRQSTLGRARMHADHLGGHGPTAILSESRREVEIVLLAAGRRMGLLRLLRLPSRSGFDAYELEVLGTLATSLALALRGADAHQEVQSLAVTDELTNLLNRRAFNNALHREFQKADRYGQALGLLLIDIDHFKAVNDRFGHPAGDSVLRQVSAYLGQTIRTVDVAARFGGEEFAVLMPGTGPGQTIAAAERIRTAILAHTFLPECRDHRVTVSIGVAQYQGEGGCAPDDLIRDADIALYRAKSNGRNRVEVAGFAGLAMSPLSPALQPTVQ